MGYEILTIEFFTSESAEYIARRNFAVVDGKTGNGRISGVFIT